ncbi:hypothetical protein [Gemmobacter sp.]|uniref:hypothetical protein n=1 Tax=Gemmobacter sp. TaxID=1898957 RepID=UPI002AFE3602|nr:hypothetical protein [Gemmobacter sp.]
MKFGLPIWLAAGMFTFGHFYATGTAEWRAQVKAEPFGSFMVSVLFWPAYWGALHP